MIEKKKGDHMLKELVDKHVEIMVAFSDYTLSGGAVPKQFTGILLDVDEDFCKIQLVKTKKVILIDRKFIISITEI